MQMENFTQKVINVMKVAWPNITRLIKAYTPRQGLSLHSKYSYAANSYSAIDYVFMWLQFGWLVWKRTEAMIQINYTPPSSLFTSKWTVHAGEDIQVCTACATKQTHGTIILENVEHCGAKPEQADTGCHWWAIKSIILLHAHSFTIHRGLWECFCLLVYVFVMAYSSVCHK